MPRQTYVLKAKTEAQLLEAAKKYVRDAKALTVQKRRATFDIETTGLYDFGYDFIRTYSFYDPDANKMTYGRVTQDEIKRGTFDKRITKEILLHWAELDEVITHNGQDFDMKVVKTRALYWGYDRLIPAWHTIAHYDTLIMKRSLLRTRGSLGSLEQFLLGETEKTHMTPQVEMGLKAGKKWAWKWLEQHNKADARSTWRVFLRLKPLSNPSSRRYV